MADLTISSSLVQPTETAPFETGVCGAAFNAGETGYLDGSVNRWKLAVASAQNSAAARGIATGNYSTGQVGRFQTAEELNLGGGVTEGEVYAVSVNAGKIAPIADVTTGNWVTTLGVGSSTNNILLQIHRSGVQKP
jgi:hypothetical protein